LCGFGTPGVRYKDSDKIPILAVMKPYRLTLLLVACIWACSSPKKKSIPAQTSDSPTIAAASGTADTTIAAAATDGQPYDYSKSDYEEEGTGVTKDWSSHKGFTVPPFGLEKVRALIGKIKVVDDTAGEDGFLETMDDKTYAALSLDEKFTYNMIHTEDYSQNCDGMPARSDLDHRIYGQLPGIFGEYSWSQRQLAFYKDNRDSVESLMKILVARDTMIGKNMRAAIVEMNGVQLIPFIVDSYRKSEGKKDHFLLTVLLLLMKNNLYMEFINSQSWTKLYGRHEDSYSAYLVFNKANEDLIIQRATNFYNGLASAK